MYKIGFQNFRRFADFQPIEYKGITFLVGRNNSGKSTLVKALLLINDFLKSDDITTFSFGSNSLEDANIVTYGRAKNKEGTRENNYIIFYYEFSNYSIEIKITGDDDKTKADIVQFYIKDTENGYNIYINPTEITFQSLYEKVNKEKTQNAILLEEYQKRKVELKKQLKGVISKTSEEFILLQQEFENIKLKIKSLRTNTKNEQENFQEISVSTSFESKAMRDVFEELIFDIASRYKNNYSKIQNRKKVDKGLNNLIGFNAYEFKIQKSLIAFQNIINKVNIIYLGATLNKQSALFAIRDKSNPLAQAIHEYKQLGIDLDMGSFVQRFVKKWMSQQNGFEIGNDFEIEMHAGEAYEVIINDNGVKTHLADKGMGSIQAMLLILRLASIIYKKAKDNQDYTIVIEEPELNLHPALQSKLAELFHEVYKDYGIKLIVETHSEYLIRKTQLIVKNCEYEVAPNENPFAVLYFDKDFTQWKMEYREDGKFKNSFGKGFYDESANLTFDLI